MTNILLGIIALELLAIFSKLDKLEENSVGFGESKAEAEARGQQLPESDGFMNIPEGADEELPFN